jgi:hypothetical protein
LSDGGDEEGRFVGHGPVSLEVADAGLDRVALAVVDRDLV